MFKWPVVPICEKQRMDVRDEDLLFGGLYRACNTYRGGGGYDQFGPIYKKRFGIALNPTQFVVQLWGCPLKCPYCYVTQDGIYSKPTFLDTAELLQNYAETNLNVFHLMGGAPAIYLKYWENLYNTVIETGVFHSDFLLVEQKYQPDWVKNLPGLHAVSIKERYLYTDKQIAMIWSNLAILINNGVNFYITFTGKDEFSNEISQRFGKGVLEDSFIIPIKQYKATLV